jgi:hypothetical protein
MDPALPLFSITIFCPRLSPTLRATAYAPPPGA